MWKAIKEYNNAQQEFTFKLADMGELEFTLWMNVSKTKEERDKGSVVTAAYQTLLEQLKNDGLDQLKSYSKPVLGEIICNRKVVGRLDVGRVTFVQSNLPPSLTATAEQLEQATRARIAEKKHG